jgi:hypothetical protein
VALVSKRTIPTERPPLVGEVSANFYGWSVSSGQRNGFPRPLLSDVYTRNIGNCVILIQYKDKNNNQNEKRLLQL